MRDKISAAYKLPHLSKWKNFTGLKNTEKKQSNFLCDFTNRSINLNLKFIYPRVVEIVSMSADVRGAELFGW